MESSSGGDESEKGQAPSPAMKSRPTSSEDDGSCGEGHSGGDSTDVNSHADETVMKLYPNVPLNDLSRFSLVSNFYSHRVREPVSH